MSATIQFCVIFLSIILCRQCIKFEDLKVENNMDKRSSGFLQNSIVKISWIRRKRVGPNIKFIVTFEKKAQNVKVYSYRNPQNSNQYSLLTLTKRGNTAWKATVFCFFNNPFCKLLFVSERGEKDFYMMTLAMNISSNSNRRARIEDIPEIRLSPDSEVVACPEEDATITTFAPRKGNKDPQMAYYISLLEQSIVTQNPGAREQPCYPDASSDEACYKIKFPTTTRELSGYIYSEVIYELDSNLAKVYMERSIVLRPHSQCEPFPPGLVMITSEWNGRNDCQIGRQCPQRCSVFGYIRSGIKVTRIGLDGTEINQLIVPTTLVPPTTNPNGIRAYMKHVKWYQSANYYLGLADNDSIVTFRCSVTNEGTGEEVSTLIQVKIVD
ncbi:hypothetical protein PoB_002891800 [Plakobranchus ocellatus]|uniref:Uncharacterized protein n=1 Tax=Plakobranchus ocellatus TaxID=259542 RepID=A0AAV4A704_9GAST|nr:hypothetical protein PoB_002891800 [Plakobranchus ocellatus]